MIALNPWDKLEESSEESKAQSLKSVEIPVPGKAIEKWIQYWLLFAFSWRAKGIMGLGVSKIWVDISNRMLDELISPKNKTLTIVLAVTENTERSMLLKWYHAEMSSAHMTMNYAKRAAEIVISMNDSNLYPALYLNWVFAVTGYLKKYAPTSPVSKSSQLTLLHLVATCSYLNSESSLWAINL